MNSVDIKANDIDRFFFLILEKIGVRPDVANYLIGGIIQASLRGVDSHGIRLFPHYLKGFEGGRLNKDPKYKFNKKTNSTGKLDGDHAPGHAAGAEGMLKAIELASDAGIGAVAVYNSSHFGAAAYYALMAAKEDMIGLSFTNATAHVLSYGGTRPFFGNNPVCMVAPCYGEEPFCLDMATTVATFNKVQQHKEAGEKVPVGWGVDDQGKDTDDAAQVASLLPIGTYKGFGLSMMVEILCSLLSGAPFGPEITHMFGTSMDQKRLLGHFFCAIRIDGFEDPAVFKKRMKKMMEALRSEPSLNAGVPVMVPGDPEKKFYRVRSQKGIPVPQSLLEQFNKLGSEYNAALSF
ncbi:MAG: Ldh family oxidoreductase [Candidatus Saganbacteria bacterium]|nr:Ldh family oxidoreductase [Candidatus Saganbacteria bacterium]